MAAMVTSNIPGINIQDLKLKGFRVHELPRQVDTSVSHGRRDFYKMGLVNGDMTICYGNEMVEIKGTALFFVNPRVSHSVVRSSKKTTGYACLFTETFIAGRERIGILKNSPLFNTGDSPAIPLNSEQAAFMTGIFQKMMTVYNGDYQYKSNLIRNCIELIINEALRIQPSKNAPLFKNAATRMTQLFMDLLERQFPIERRDEPLRLRTAKDFAICLSVHENYLNRSIKEITGKPVSVHIAERIATEAKALLQFTDWTVAEIAYSLGFEYPTYFNNYFKRVTGTTPKMFRK